jgi:hypothetical protein
MPFASNVPLWPHALSHLRSGEVRGIASGQCNAYYRKGEIKSFVFLNGHTKDLVVSSSCATGGCNLQHSFEGPPGMERDNIRQKEHKMDCSAAIREENGLKC